MLSAIIYRSAGVLLLSLILSASAAAAAATLQGRLMKPTDGNPIQLVSADGPVTLVVDELQDATMRDPQLADRTWQLRGHESTDGGAFKVDRAFTIKDGKLYRVTYYCEICNITTYDPGRCMCCQEDTELREIPED